MNGALRIELRCELVAAAMRAQGRLERRSRWKKSRAEESRVEWRRVRARWRDQMDRGALCLANSTRQRILALCSARAGRKAMVVGRQGRRRQEEEDAWSMRRTTR